MTIRPSSFLFSLFLCFALASCTLPPTPKAYRYESVLGDPLGARVYTLKNGLKVYLSVYKNEPRIQTYIAVKAGSKFDPSDATGLAHYLEHMLFKGTDRFGTLNAEEESYYIAEIIRLYDVYKVTPDSLERRAIYSKIDSLSFLASRYAIANEYDKLVASLGATGTNAYTSFEQTVYTNDIPSNQLKKWLDLEAERFRKPVMRLFHTELEVVYEEKNRGLDNDGTKVFETLMSALFPTHQYGTQTVIGTIDHLKNPSIQAVIDYYNTYYVPNNMAICLSGDFDPDSVIVLIDQAFGGFSPRPLPKFAVKKEPPLTEARDFTVVGPNAESVTFAYRFPGIGTRDADLLMLCDMILSNSAAGLIDLNIVQKQLALNAGCSPIVLNDYSIHRFYGRNRADQSLEEVRDLLRAEIERVKTGDFPDWLPKAVITNLKLSQMKAYEYNEVRADAMVGAFTSNIPWPQYVRRLERLSAYSKKDIMDFATRYYREDNVITVYKRKGTDTTVQRVQKPPITSVELNRDSTSYFASSLLTQESPTISPVFLDFERAFERLETKTGLPIYYVKNSENGLFDLSVVYDLPLSANPKLSLAFSYLDYLGTDSLSAEAIKEAFYKLGCSYTISLGEDQLTIQLSGLNENMGASLSLLESLLAAPAPNPAALSNLVDDVLKTRRDRKLNKSAILGSAMLNYAKFGTAPLKMLLSESDLRAITPDELIESISSLSSLPHRILYYGPESPDKLSALLQRVHRISDKPLSLDTTDFAEREITEPIVYYVPYDMQQVEMLLISKGTPYAPDISAEARLFNEYFGSGMQSIVFQELRESRALAYSVSATLSSPSKPTRSHYSSAYIGTQADKLSEALESLFALFKTMPRTEANFNAARQALLQSLSTERVTKMNILYAYENMKKMGYSGDIRKRIYDRATSSSLDRLADFHATHFKDKRFAILVIGDEAKVDFKVLSKYGKVEKLSLEEIFGY